MSYVKCKQYHFVVINRVFEKVDSMRFFFKFKNKLAITNESTCSLFPALYLISRFTMTMLVHESDLYTMRGAGIGSFFSNLFKGLIPLASKLFKVGTKAARSEVGQRVLNATKRTALEAGLDIAHDTLKGKNLKDSAKEHLTNAGDKMLEALDREFVRTRNKRGGRVGGKKKKASGKKGKKKPQSKKKLKTVTTTTKKKKKTKTITSVSKKRVTKGKKKKRGAQGRSRADLLSNWI